MTPLGNSPQPGSQSRRRSKAVVKSIDNRARQLQLHTRVGSRRGSVNDPERRRSHMIDNASGVGEMPGYVPPGGKIGEISAAPPRRLEPTAGLVYRSLSTVALLVRS